MFPFANAPSVTTRNAITLIHLSGFLTGIVLYAMLGAMAGLRARNRRADRDGVLLLVAVIGLAWNVGALVTYAATDFGFGAAPQWLTAAAFSALGFLPAAVIQLAVAPSSRRRALVSAAYTLSVVASLLHVIAAVNGTAPSPAALWLLSLGFPVVLLGLIVTGAARAAGARAISAAALAAFATTALHLSHHSPQVEESVTAAVLGHQGSLPLVLTILYQDYRFALADLFLKRAVSLMLLVAMAALGYLLIVAPALANPNADPLLTPLLILALWVLTALAFPPLRIAVGTAVDRALLRRPDYSRLRAAVGNRLRGAESQNAVADVLCTELRFALAAGYAEWREEPGGSIVDIDIISVTRDGRASAVMHLPLAEAPGIRVAIGELRGGRRLLSDDVALLEWLAIAAARRIDEIRVAQERLEQSVRAVELTRLATQAELQALRAQLNPHFLFNALTTIGQLISEAPDRALATIYQLTGLLRAVLRSPGAELVPLSEEVDIVAAYLSIEMARFEERLIVEIDVPDELRSALVPALLLQPLVENAVKHGIGPRRQGGMIRVSARVGEPPADAHLELEVSDTGAGCEVESIVGLGAGRFGISSVQRRLQRHFAAAAKFEMTSVPGSGTTVRIRLPLHQSNDQQFRAGDDSRRMTGAAIS